MGCRQSTMEGKEQVVATRARCKERMKLMEDAVQFRNHFAASQASYAVTLKWTGEVLTDYSLGEVQHLIPPSSSSIPPPSSPSSSSSTSRGSSVEPPLPPPINSNIPFLPPPSHLLPQRPSEMKQLVKQISSSSSSSSSSSAAAAAAADGAKAQLPPPINSNSNIPSPPPPPAFPQHCSWEKKRLAKLKSAAAAAGGAGLGSDGERKITACAGLSENLAQRFNNLNDDFLKASESAHEVSKMMEATRMNYEPNFADNRGYIDPSARIMQVITWNRAFRGLPCEDDEFSESERENLANVLDKMLAWEKKLYEEMKACELMKIEYLMMVALFNKQKKCGASPQTLEETQVAFNHLHARYIAELQSMNWTVSEINNLQDNQLYMRLVDLVGGLAEMWETMHAQHTSQLKIIWDLKNLDFSLAPKETSEQHLEGTVHLHGLLGRWSSEFQDLVRYEKAYIRALNDWVNLNLIPIESNLNDEVSSPPCILQPAIQRLLQTWHNLLEKLPYKQAIDAIDSFRKAVHVIIRIIEEDELKMKRRCEETRRKYMRKSMRKYKKGAAASEEETASGADPENREMANRGDTRTERNGVLERLKMRLTDDEESYQRICKQVREKAVQSIRTHLVEFIRAMAEFALACSEMYRKLRSIATRSQNTMMAD